MGEPVTIEHLQALKPDSWLHVDLGKGGTMWTFSSKAFPRLKVTDYKADRNTPQIRYYTVDGVDHQVDTLGDVVHLLNGEEDVVGLKEDMRSVAAFMSQAAGKLNLMTESGRLNPDEVEAACAAAEQALMMMPGLREKVEAFRVEHKAKSSPGL